MKIGILLHVYHLETDGWDNLVWGNPGHGELGTGTKFLECLLDIPVTDEVTSIVYSGPSHKAGLTEGAYTKQYLVDRLDTVAKIPRLQAKIDQLTAAEYDQFIARVHALVLGPKVQNTAAELQNAGDYFRRRGVDRVLEIAAATHAPRCMRNQAAARYRGVIDIRQQWFLVAGDTNYAHHNPDEVIIAEPIHRKDNPLYDFHPAWSEVTALYPRLSLENKQRVLRQIDTLMADALAQQPESTEVAN